MKKILLSLLACAILLSITQCTNSSADRICANTADRSKVISTLVNNESYMTEVMDSMRTRHHEVIVTNFLVLAKNDKAVQMEMMNNMMSMCSSDSSMCKMMMGKTMEMCDADQSKCNMMMGSMKSHPNVMKAMKGMCDMDGMKMDQK